MLRFMEMAWVKGESENRLLASLRFGSTFRARLTPALSPPSGSGEGVLRLFRRFTRRPVSVLAAIILLNRVSPMAAAEPNETRQSPTVNVPAEKLERTIGEVLQQREYSWRLPREKNAVAKEEKGWLGQFIDSVTETIEGALKKAGDWLEDLWRWIFKPPSIKPGPSPVLDWTAALKALLILLIVVCAGFLAFLIVRFWQRWRHVPAIAAAAPAAAPPDLTDENVGADQLPEDGWLRMGRELMGAGDLRLALRAFYLASLAHLAERNLIALARFKSNRDYTRELQRRGHALPQLVSLFGENVPIFERVWYGRHEVSPELVGEFSGRVERMRAAS